MPLRVQCLFPTRLLLTNLGAKKRKSISLPELISIKETYGISVQAIMARALNLGIIDKHRYVKFRKYISNNREEKDLGHYQGKEHSDRFMQLVYRAASEEIISLSKAANLSNEKLAAFRDQFIALMTIVVNDANILIDLVKLQILNPFFWFGFSVLHYGFSA